MSLALTSQPAGR